MSGSINKILNDALDQTILTESGENFQKPMSAEDKQRELYARTGTPGKIGSQNKGMPTLKSQTAALKAQDTAYSDPNNLTEPGGTPLAKGTDWAKYGKYGGIGLAGIGAGIGAVMLAKKLRAKKKAADAKAAKKAKK